MSIIFILLANLLLCLFISIITTVILTKYFSPISETFSYNKKDNSIKTGTLKISKNYLTNCDYYLNNHNINNVNSLNCKKIICSKDLQIDNIKTNKILANKIETESLSNNDSLTIKSDKLENIENVKTKDIKTNSLIVKNINGTKINSSNIETKKLASNGKALKIDITDSVDLSDSLKNFIIETLLPNFIIMRDNYFGTKYNDSVLNDSINVKRMYNVGDHVYVYSTRTKLSSGPRF